MKSFFLLIILNYVTVTISSGPLSFQGLGLDLTRVPSRSNTKLGFFF